MYVIVTIITVIQKLKTFVTKNDEIFISQNCLFITVNIGLTFDIETLKHAIVKSTLDSLGSRYNSEVHRNQ